jgi:antitoxin MazE
VRVSVQKWGNSLALRIPKALAEAAGVRQGSEVEVSVEAGRLVAEPVVRIPTLEELLAGMTEENRHGEAWPNDAPRGREILDPWPEDEIPPHLKR